MPRSNAALIRFLTWPAPLFLAYSAMTGGVFPLNAPSSASGVLQTILFIFVGWRFTFTLLDSQRMASPPTLATRIVISSSALALVAMPMILAASSPASSRFLLEFLLWIATGSFGAAWWVGLTVETSPEIHSPDFATLSSKQRLLSLTRRIVVHPYDEKALAMRAAEYVERGAYGSAMKDIEEGLLIATERRDRFLNLRHLVHISRKQFDQALADIREAIDSGPDEFRDHYHTAASLYSKLGQPEEALRILDRAVATFPGDPMPYIRRAKSLGTQGRTVPASEDLDTALSLARARSDHDALLERIKVLMLLGHFNQALTGCNELIAAQRNDRRLHALGLYDLRSEINTGLGNRLAAKADSDKSMELARNYR